MVSKRLFYIPVFSLLSLFANAQVTKEAQGIPLMERVEFSEMSAALLKPETVTSLKLNKQGLKQLPDLSKFKNLVELDLSDNDIVDFTSGLSGLDKLESINLSGNELTVIPTDLCNLKKLKSLNLSTNKITSGSLACLPGLERIYLNNNSLTAIPAGITDLQNLKSLYIQSNLLTVLPENFAKMPHLEALLVQLNKIHEEPNVYKLTGIVNYIFEPQAVNPRYLYRYYAEHPVIVFTEAVSPQVLNFGEDEEASSTQGVSALPKDKWQRFGTYSAIRLSYGRGSHKAIREEEMKDRLVRRQRRFIGFEGEFGFKNYAIAYYFSTTNISYYDYDGNRYTGTDELQVSKFGFNFKMFFAPLSSKMRPYGKVGLGLNRENDYYLFGNRYVARSYYGTLNLQARVGVDLYLNRFIGVNLETGLGAGNVFSYGLIFRIPIRKKG
jgi:hypothetical protein